VAQPCDGHLTSEQVTLIVNALMDSSTEFGAGAATH
jgi:hypothetical protein